MTLNDIPTRSPGVVSRLMDGEAVLVHGEQGQVRVLNETGAHLWQLCDGVLSIGDLAAALAAEYDVDFPRAQADALAFCADLAERGVLVIGG